MIKNNMLLTLDIGNTNINFGVFSLPRCHDAKLLQKFILPTKEYSLRALKTALGRNKINAAVICSVVPATAKILKNDLEKMFPGKVYLINKNIRLPIKNLYRYPAQVGQDRLVNAYAGVTLYKAPLIVVDSGTAVTFDVISKNGEYLGGMIIPGLAISLAALAEKTALLPKINLAAPKEFIGRDTKNSMLSGIIFGFAALTDDLVKRIKDMIGKRALVIGTGGNIRMIAKYCKELDKIDPDLTLKGLMLAYDNRK